MSEGDVPAMTEDDAPAGNPLEALVVVLHRPRDLVNVALVVRAMKNMDLRRLRLVRPSEFDPYRIEGIAHDTADVVEAARLFDSLEEAVADAVRVAGTTARRRAHPRRWSTPEDAAPGLLRRAGRGPVALVFGPEDRGLTNEELDLCHELLSLPVSPEHPSLNLAHAALLVFYEMRRAAVGEGRVPATPDLSPGADRTAPPATAGELERFYAVWREAMEEIGFFHGIDPGPKMRSFRSLFRRAEPDGRELGLLEAAAYEILHYARRTRARLRQEMGEAAEERRRGSTSRGEGRGAEEGA